MRPTVWKLLASGQTYICCEYTGLQESSEKEGRAFCALPSFLEHDDDRAFIAFSYGTPFLGDAQTALETPRHLWSSDRFIPHAFSFLLLFFHRYFSPSPSPSLLSISVSFSSGLWVNEYSWSDRCHLGIFHMTKTCDETIDTSSRTRDICVKFASVFRWEF